METTVEEKIMNILWLSTSTVVPIDDRKRLEMIASVVREILGLLYQLQSISPLLKGR